MCVCMTLIYDETKLLRFHAIFSRRRFQMQPKIQSTMSEFYDSYFSLINKNDLLEMTEKEDYLKWKLIFYHGVVGLYSAC